MSYHRRAAPKVSASGLIRPYFDPSAPTGPRMTGLEFLAWVGATNEERALVRAGVQRLRAYEQDMARRVTEPRHSGYRNGSRPRAFVSAEDLLNAAGVPCWRQVTLMAAMLRFAREQGITMNFTTLSEWRKKLLARRDGTV